MKGDQCPYDHGDDALVVDDLTITSTGSVEAKPAAPVESKLPPTAAVIGPPPSQPVLPMGIPIPPPPLVSCLVTRNGFCFGVRLACWQSDNDSVTWLSL